MANLILDGCDVTLTAGAGDLANTTGTSLLRGAIELQEGYAMSPSVAFDNTAITIDKNSFVSWRNSQVDWVLGISIASGSGVTVTNNTLITNRSTLAGCNATPVTATPWEKWGMEFTAVNSSAKTNTFCGFDYSIGVGHFGSRKFTSGTDVINLDDNTLANMYVSGIEMFPGDTAAYGPYGQRYDDAMKTFVETPAAAKARWAANFEAIDRQLLVNNKFTNTRITAFNGGFTWLNGSPVPVNGVWQNYSHIPDNFTSHVKKLTMTSNVVDRAYGFFPTDIAATVIYWNDKRFIGMAIPAIVTATNLGVSSNTVNLSNAPAAGTDFMYRGMEVSPLISGDDGKNYDPSKTLLNSKVWLNTVTAATKQFGSTVYLNDASAAPGSDPRQGPQIQGNLFKNTLVGVDTQSTLVRSSFSGNTCTTVAKLGPGC